MTTSPAIRRLAIRRLVGRALAVATIGCTAALLLGACSTGPSGAESPKAATTASTRLVADALVPDTNATYAKMPSPAARLLSASQAEGLTSMPWRFLSGSANGRSIHVVYVRGDNSCVTPVGFLIEIKGETIELEALSRTDTAQTACADPLSVAAATVSLPIPLTQGATLLHAPVASQWSNPGLLRP